VTIGSATALRRQGAYAVVAALRPHQWTKNLLLFAGILFAAQLQDPVRWSQALVAFAAYSMLSSAGYLVNDVRDAEQDRLHLTKRLRPIARGDLTPRNALVLAALLVCGGLGLAAALGLESILFAGVFCAGQLVYTLLLKRLYLVDALAIAGLFTIRAAAGAAAVNVHISNWLLLCTAALALFLTFAKRRGEVLSTATQPAVGRAVLQHYSLRRLGALVWSCAAAALLLYGAYTLTGAESNEMAVTIPFVVFGLARYLYLMQRHDLGEEPDRVLLTDVPILLAVALWAVVAAIVLTAA
jgi:4-hydroxybenzoate polyprenyltransferase